MGGGPTEASSGFTENGPLPKRIKYPLNGNALGENEFLMPEISGD